MDAALGRAAVVAGGGSVVAKVPLSTACSSARPAAWRGAWRALRSGAGEAVPDLNIHAINTGVLVEDAKVKKKGQLLLLRSTKLLCVLGKLGLGGLCTFYGIRGAPREGAAAPLLAVGAGLRARTQASREWEPMQDVL